MKVLVWIRSYNILSDLALITSGGRVQEGVLQDRKGIVVAAETFTSQW